MGHGDPFLSPSFKSRSSVPSWTPPPLLSPTSSQSWELSTLCLNMEQILPLQLTPLPLSCLCYFSPGGLQLPPKCSSQLQTSPLQRDPSKHKTDHLTSLIKMLQESLLCQPVIIPPQGLHTPHLQSTRFPAFPHPLLLSLLRDLESSFRRWLRCQGYLLWETCLDPSAYLTPPSPIPPDTFPIMSHCTIL